MINQNEKEIKSNIIPIEINSKEKERKNITMQTSNCNQKTIDIVLARNNLNKKRNEDDPEKKNIPTLNNIEQNISSVKKTLASIEAPDSNRRNSSEKYPLSQNDDNKQLSENRNLIMKSPSQNVNDEISNLYLQNNDDCATIHEDNDKPNIPEIKINQIKMSLNEFVKKSTHFTPTMCFLCDKYFQENTMFKTPHCHHYFCRKCGKLYYEEKIEQGDNEMKCPMYTCKGALPIEFLELLVSNQHFDGLKGGKNEAKNNRHHQIFNKELTENITMQKMLQNKIDTIKPYSNRHVLDINTNEAFYMFTQTKDQFCPKCNENSLFSKNGNHFIKCLNCFHSICKYCFTRYDAFHMDISTADHCKVYYRKKEKNYMNDNQLKFFGLQFLLVMASFLIMFVASFHYLKNWIMILFCIKNEKLKSIGIAVLVYCITTLFFLCSIPFILLSFPYFPVIIEAIG